MHPTARFNDVFGLPIIISVNRQLPSRAIVRISASSTLLLVLFCSTFFFVWCCWFFGAADLVTYFGAPMPNHLLIALTLCSPFLQFVSDTATFDEQLKSYVQTTYVQEKLAAHLRV